MRGKQEDPCVVYLGAQLPDLSMNPCHEDTALGWEEKYMDSLSCLQRCYLHSELGKMSSKVLVTSA